MSTGNSSNAMHLNNAIALPNLRCVDVPCMTSVMVTKIVMRYQVGLESWGVLADDLVVMLLRNGLGLLLAFQEAVERLRRTAF